MMSGTLTKRILKAAKTLKGDVRITLRTHNNTRMKNSVTQLEAVVEIARRLNKIDPEAATTCEELNRDVVSFKVNKSSVTLEFNCATYRLSRTYYGLDVVQTK